MIKKFLALILCLLPLFSFSVSAKTFKNDNVKIKLPERFNIISVENSAKYSDFLKTMNFSVKDFDKYLEDYGISFFAVTDDLSEEVTLSVIKTEFSENIKDFMTLGDESIQAVTEELLGVTDYKVKQFDKYLYIVSETLKSDNGGEYVSYQFITVKNYNMIVVTYATTGKNSAVAADIEEALGNIKITDTSKKSYFLGIENIATLIVLILSLIFVFAVSIYLIYTFVRDIKTVKSKNSNDVAPYVKIKRRKF